MPKERLQVSPDEEVLSRRDLSIWDHGDDGEGAQEMFEN